MLAIDVDWQAVGALAATVEAVGVVIALVYAARQVQAPGSWRHERAATSLSIGWRSSRYDRLQPAVNELLTKWTTVATSVHLWRKTDEELVQAVGRSDADRIRQNLNEQYKTTLLPALRTAAAAATAASDRMVRD
ncbi:MAG: hypothetical protein H0U21_08350 [Acidimicrobiia bacterium]|nr:hypothetical protein [Acidimicrobiia bacterium]